LFLRRDDLHLDDQLHSIGLAHFSRLESTAGLKAGVSDPGEYR
jgi:hypothetical protein